MIKYFIYVLDTLQITVQYKIYKNINCMKRIAMIEQLKDKSKTATQLEKELSVTKKETIFLDTKIIVNSRFDNFFEFLDTKDTKIGDTFNEKILMLF